MHRTEDRFTGEWTQAERSEYATLRSGRDAGTPAPLPLLVRETLLSMRDESPEDEDLARALEAVGGADATGGEARREAPADGR